MPGLIDVAFAVVLLVAASLFEHYYFWPRFRADIASGRTGARVSGYLRGIVGQWLFGAGALAIWITMDRPWSALRLTLPAWWGFGFALAAAGLLALQLWSVLRLPQERREAARPKLGAVSFLLPHTAREYGWFVALSVTAGFCEELLYRGYLVWFFTPWLGPIGAMLFVVAAFGVGHLYQGRRGAIKATLAGVVMAAIVLITNSLIPAMIAHALIDVGGGTIGYLLLRDRQPTSLPAPARTPRSTRTTAP